MVAIYEGRHHDRVVRPSTEAVRRSQTHSAPTPGAITALVVPTTISAQAGRVRARSLNHVNIGVSDVARSETFYRELLGLPSRRYILCDAYALDFPDGGLISLWPVEGSNCSLAAGSTVAGKIDHFGVGIDNSNAQRVASELEATGI